MNIVFELPAGTKASNLYKMIPPYREVGQGHGLLGVVLTREDGKLQCHVCGNWFNSLSMHIVRKHGIRTRVYRKMFGLQIKDSLESCKIVEQKRLRFNNHMTPDSRKLAQQKGLEIRLNSKDLMRKTALAVNESQHSMSYVNGFGLCPDQIDARYDIVAMQVNRVPTYSDLERWDLPVAKAIVSRYGTINEYRIIRGDKTRIPGQLPNTKSEIIAALRKHFLSYGVIRGYKLSGKCCESNLRRHFGNVRNACRAAGINPSNWTMVG